MSEQMENNALLQIPEPHGSWAPQLHTGMVLVMLGAFAVGVAFAKLVQGPTTLYITPPSVVFRPSAVVPPMQKMMKVGQPHVGQPHVNQPQSVQSHSHVAHARQMTHNVFAESVYDFAVKDAHGEEKSLAEFKGKVLLIVNVASESRFTPQYRGLHELQEKYKGMPFSIIAFPCNQFNQEEPAASEEVAEFAKENFAADFPIMEKVDVNGEDAAALYRYLKEQKHAFPLMHDIKSNFEKFLVDKNGKVVEHYTAMRAPETIVPDIDRLLSQQTPSHEEN